jgi:hypothetical protein
LKNSENGIAKDMAHMFNTAHHLMLKKPTFWRMDVSEML